jgi:hypothetical protein
MRYSRVAMATFAENPSRRRGLRRRLTRGETEANRQPNCRATWLAAAPGVAARGFWRLAPSRFHA